MLWKHHMAVFFPWFPSFRTGLDSWPPSNEQNKLCVVKKTSHNLKYRILPEQHSLYKLPPWVKPHKLRNSPAKGGIEGWNSIRMVLAGERAGLTEQESHPAFLCCDGKWSNCASVKDQTQWTLTHMHTQAQPPSACTCFPSRHPFLYGESADHTMSRLPLRLSSIHPEDAKGSGWEGWLTSTSHPGLTSPHHHYNNIHSDPAVNHPASSHGAVCTCYCPTSNLPSFTLMHPYLCTWIHSRSIARNASLRVHSPAASLRPPLNIGTNLARWSLILARGQLCCRDWKYLSCQHREALSISPAICKLWQSACIQTSLIYAH